MNKLLTTLGAITLLLSGVSPFAIISTTNHHNNSVATSKNNQAVIKRHHKFDIWNLSTWGDKQKQVIVSSYIKSATSWYQNQISKSLPKTWSQWNTDYSGIDNNLNTLINSFELINHAFNNRSFNFTVEPYPSGSSDLGKDLLNGIHYYIKALPQSAFTGQIDFIVKGNINPPNPWSLVKPAIPLSPQKTVNAIKNKISQFSLDVPDGTPISVANPQTILAIKKSLQKNNVNLTNLDLQKFYFDPEITLALGYGVGVPTKITYKDATASIMLSVLLH